MIRQIIHLGRQRLPQGVLEQAGVLIWLTGVLLIGLRLTLLVPHQPLLRRVLQLSATTLIGFGLVTGLIAALSAATQLLHARVRVARAPTRGARITPSGRPARRIVIPTPGQLLALAVDEVLAATLIRTALGWADESSLRPVQLAPLAGIGMLHLILVVLHDHRARPPRS